MLTESFIAIDLHKQNSVIGHMDQSGRYHGHWKIQTTGGGLINAINAIHAQRKVLTLEQGNMSHWAANLLAQYVDKLIVCDPRKNQWIGAEAVKNDGLDTYKLCELTRLGSIQSQFQDFELGRRRLFWSQMKEYLRANRMMVIAKQQLAGLLTHWGYPINITRRHYERPVLLLEHIDQPELRIEIEAKLQLIESLSQQKKAVFDRAKQTAKPFREVARFQKVPGVGPIGAHLFSALIQNPYRFRRRGQLIKFCQLAVRHHSSDGKPTKSQRLIKAGHADLKQISYRAWQTAVQGDNEVSAFYWKSLQRCGDHTKARLNTQRKILICLWTLWKNDQPYKADRFCGVSTR